MTTDVEVMAQAVAQGVGSYKRRRPWLDEGDLRQEAWTGALEAYRTWDSERGPLAPYVTRAVYLRIKRWALRTGPMSFTDNTAGRAAFAEGSPRGAPLDKALELAALETPADEALDETYWRIRLYARMVETAGGRASLRVALEAKPPRFVAQHAAEVRARLAADGDLRALWMERSEQA